MVYAESWPQQELRVLARGMPRASPRRGGAGFFGARWVQLWNGSEGWKSPSGVHGQSSWRGLGRSPQKLKKHRKLCTLEKHFVRHTWCQNDETVILPAMLYMGEGHCKSQGSRFI